MIQKFHGSTKKNIEILSRDQTIILAKLRALNLKMTLHFLDYQLFLLHKNTSFFGEKEALFSFIFCIHDIDRWQYFLN